MSTHHSNRIVLSLVLAAATAPAARAFDWETCGSLHAHLTGGQIAFRVTTAEFPPGGAFTNALYEAADAWNDGASNVTYSFYRDDATPAETDNDDHINDIMWSQFLDETALTLVTFSPSNCTIYDVDMIFNASAGLTTSSSKSDLEAYEGNGRSFQAVAIHEFGHAQGLQHTNDSYSVMGLATTHLHTNAGTAKAYVGEDATAQSIAVYGAKPGTFEDLALSHWRWTGATTPGGEYAVHGRTRLYEADGSTELSKTETSGDVRYTVTPGQSVRFEVTHENLGKSSLVANVGYFLSTNDNITTQDRFLGYDIRWFSPDEAETLKSKVLTIPDDLDGGTQYWLGAIADYDQHHPEVGETNNRTYVAIKTVEDPPNFQATAVYGPGNATAGDDVLLTVVIDNIGGAHTGSYGYDIYLSENGTITKWDRLLASKTTSGFGSKLAFVTLPGDLPADIYYFGIIVNHEDGELDKFNNSVSSSPVAIAAGPVDLKAAHVDGPIVCAAGQPIQVECTIDNVGGVYGGLVNYQIRVSPNFIADTGDYLVKSATTALGTHQLDATFPNLAPGTYYWALTVTTLPGEPNEANNVLLGHRVVVVEAPDLVAQSISAAADVTPGGNYKVAFSTASLGAPYGGAYEYEISLKSPGAGTINFVAFTGHTTTFGPQAVKVQLPASLPSGSYQWRLSIKPVTYEFETANNVVWGNAVTVH